MAIRFAAASGLALAAALIATPAARAQGFFQFYEMSPRQIAGILADDGYQLRGAMLRRGDVYVCDVVSVSGRSVRLIVSARDGRVIERFANDDRHRYSDDNSDRRRYSDDNSDWRAPRPPREIGQDDDRSAQPHDQWAFGDNPGPAQPRTYGNDFLFGPKPAAPAPTPDEGADAPKPKHHAVKKHHEPAVAKAPATEPSPTPTTAAAPAESPDASPATAAAPATTPAPVQSAPSPAPSPSVAAVAPRAPAISEKPAVESVKPSSEAKTAPRAEPTKVAAPEKPKTVEAEKAPTAEKPKAEPPRKKINDLPVGTLD